MAKLVFGLNQSLDGYVEHTKFLPSPARDSAFLIAETFAWRGDKEQAFAWLERAYERHDSLFFNLKSEPRFASLLGDPRYHALLRKLNLPE